MGATVMKHTCEPPDDITAKRVWRREWKSFYEPFRRGSAPTAVTSAEERFHYPADE